MNAPLHAAPITGGFALGARQQGGQRLFRLSEDVEGIGRAGEIITLAVTPADVSVQTTELDTYLGGYSPYGFCADMCSPIVLVDKEAGQRRDLSKENAFEPVDTLLGRNGAFKEIDPHSALTSYRVQDYGLASWLPWSTENDAASLYNVRAVTGEMLMDKLALGREIRVFDSLTTTTNWNANNYATITTNYKWNTGTTKNPRADLQARIKASAQPITRICMNPDVAYWFLSDTEVRAYMKQMLGDGAPSPAVAEAAQNGSFEMLGFVVPGYAPFMICPAKKLNVSTGNLEYVLGNSVVLLSTPPGAPRDGRRVATHWTYRYRGRSGTGIVTNEYIPQGRGLNGGTMFETGFSDDSFFGSNIAGGLLDAVLS